MDGHVLRSPPNEKQGSDQALPNGETLRPRVLVKVGREVLEFLQAHVWLRQFYRPDQTARRQLDRGPRVRRGTLHLPARDRPASLSLNRTVVRGLQFRSSW